MNKFQSDFAKALQRIKARKLAKAKAAKVKAVVPESLPSVEPIAPPAPEHPLAARWAVQSIKLAPGKAKWFVVLPEPYFATVQECGTPMISTRHILTLYTRLPDDLKVSDILERQPIAKVFSRPFLFHSQQSALQAITDTIHDLADNL